MNKIGKMTYLPKIVKCPKCQKGMPKNEYELCQHMLDKLIIQSYLNIRELGNYKKYLKYCHKKDKKLK